MNTIGEREFDLSKLLIYILKKWKILLLFGVVAAIGFGSVKYIKDVATIRASQEAYDMQEIEQSFTEKERKSVEFALKYKEQLNNETKYFENSIYMSKDPYVLSKISLHFNITLVEDENNGEQDYLVNNLLSAYSAFICGGDLAQAISDAYDIENKEYITELLNYEYNQENANNASFTILLIEDEQISEAERIIVELLENYSQELNKVIGIHKLNFISQYTEIVVDRTLANLQQNVLNNIYNIDYKINSMLSTFSLEQLAYYNNKLEPDEGDSIVTVTEDGLSASIDLKYIILGAVVGLFAGAAVLVLYYMLSGYVVGEMDYATVFGLNYIGSLKNAVVLAKVSENQDIKASDLDIIVLKLKHICAAKNINSIVLTSSLTDITTKNYLDVITVKMQDKGINVSFVQDILNSQEDMKKLFDIGNCVFVEQTGCSKLKIIDKMVTFCKENDIKVLGVLDLN